MKKFILSMAVLLAASFAASAQVLDFYIGADVNGIDCFTKCNYDKFVSVFGKPDKYIREGGGQVLKNQVKPIMWEKTLFPFQTTENYITSI